MGIFAYAIYTLLVLLRDNEKENLSYKVIIINAFWAGVLFWSKFTLVGIYIGWVVVVITIYAYRKKYKEIAKFIGIYLLVVFVVTLPWIIYFAWNNELVRWFQYYLWNNIFVYGSNVEVSIFSRIIQAIKSALKTLKDSGNWSYSIGIIAGGIGYILMSKTKVTWSEKIAVALMAAGMALGIFIGGTQHDYYGLPLAVFIVFGVLMLQILIDKFFPYMKNLKKKYMTVIGCGLAMFLAAIMCVALSPNIYLLQYEREEMPQYRFAAQIQKSEDTSVLNYGFLDGGFYTVLNQVPNVRYFCVMNINRGEVLAEQTSYVEQKLTQWLVTWKAYEITEEEARQLPIVSDYYDLVDYQYFFFEGDMRTYLLYQRKP